MAVDRGTDQTYRDFDPARGPFEPSGAQAFPPKTAENPQGTRRINKTHQDHQPVSDRQRVMDANIRREAMKHS